MDLDLKKVYTGEGGVCKPSAALAAISRSMEGWIDKSETAVTNDHGKIEIIASFNNLRLTQPGLWWRPLLM